MVMDRYRGKEVYANFQYRNMVTLAAPTVTSSADALSTSGDAWAVTVVVPADAGIGSTGNRRPTVWPFYMSTDSDGLLRVASANFLGSSNGTVGGVILDSTLAFTQGKIVTNSTGHAIVMFTHSTLAGTTSYFNLVRPDGQRVAVVSLITAT